MSCDLFIWDRFFFCLPMAAFPNADDAKRRVLHDIVLALVRVIIGVLSATVFLLMVLLLLFLLLPAV